jgi:hypothetical protein
MPLTYYTRAQVERMVGYDLTKVSGDNPNGVRLRTLFGLPEEMPRTTAGVRSGHIRWADVHVRQLASVLNVRLPDPLPHPAIVPVSPVRGLPWPVLHAPPSVSPLLEDAPTAMPPATG